MTIGEAIGTFWLVDDLWVRGLAIWHMLLGAYRFGKGNTEAGTFNMATSAAFFALLASGR